ncbi:MAG TPA: PAS domain S-box protein [Syntrophorhabdaceae bacterium]|nr:PAS domain S-box protein [Syntrophorhabdaceae bacterium]HQM82845.1 PAS domain S-box protein [Syntrophorhabdaceae bacterium]
MGRKEKTRDELFKEISDLRECVVQFEKVDAERKNAEAALRQTEEKYRKMFENATEGIFQTSVDGKFLSANPSLARIHGYDSPEDLMRSITNINRQLYVNPSDRLTMVNLLKRHGVAQNFEVQMYRKDGNLQWIMMNVREVRDDKGNTLYYEGTMQDITRRKKAEAALMESEERYRTAIEHSNDGVAIIHENKHQYVNKRFVDMFEYDSADEIIAKPVTIVAHPDDVEKLISINNRRQRNEPVPSRYEFKGITKKGKTIYVEVSAAVIPSRGIFVYLVYLRDITGRKQAEETLRNERNRFRALSDNAPFGIIMIDPDGTFTYLNPKFKELFGYDLNDVPSGSQWIKKAFPDPVYRKNVIIAWINDMKYSKPGHKLFSRTFDVACKDQTSKTVNFIPVQLATGEYILTCEDITERIQAHEALIQSRNELEKLNRAKTKAVNHVSHELKTPLSVIQGNIRILKRKLENTQLSYQTIKGLLESLERNLERLLNISKETDKIFSVSQELEAGATLDELDRIWQRIEGLSDIPRDIRTHWNIVKEWMNQYMAGSTLSFQLIDLYSFILPIIEKAKHAAKHRVIDFEVEGHNDLFVFMDPVILKDVGEGLIKNAIENTPDGGRIRVSVEQRSDRVLLHVADTGVGITDDNRQYLFDGLFHTKDTEMYSSKRPYDFGAGGKGLELLRMKFYGKRFGFEISLASTRCSFIPTDQDLCPGAISQCPYCKTEEDCFNSGGTTFTVSFPVGQKARP